MPLSNLACRGAKPSDRPIKLSDGGGLFLLVQPSGGKLWRLAYRFASKQKTLALGVFPHVSLKVARLERDEAKVLLAKGIDPSEERKASRRKSQLEAENSFRAIAQEWFGARNDGWTVAYSERIWRRIEADLLPTFGDQAITNIEPPMLLDAIRKVEQRGAVVLAKRLLQVSGQIFRYAVASGRATRDPSQDLRGALRAAPPAKRRTALRANQLASFFEALDSYVGDRRTALGLRLVVHTFLRTSEVRFGRWDEIESIEDSTPLWRIPAERMKVRAEHIVPLSSQVVKILKELKGLAGASPLIFPAPTKEGVISQNTLIYALYRMGFHSRATVHGFRGTASTILNENGFNRDWIERQLAHVENNGVRAAYNTAE